MIPLKYLFSFIFSPRLYKIYGDNPYQGYYKRNNLEKWSDPVIDSLNILFNISLYTSPVVAIVLYKKIFDFGNLAFFAKLVIGLGLVQSSSYCIRSIGRFFNPAYIIFYETLSKRPFDSEVKRALNNYDFEFYAWPVEFSWDEVEGDDSKPRVYVEQPVSRTSVIDSVLSTPCRILSFIAAHTFGILLTYPGSIKILQYMMTFQIQLGRERLIEDFKGERFKLKARGGKYVDSMFIDRRKKHSNGSTLVVCCEGNAGFYETGIAMTPIQAGYSVLAWNHPGFGGSTGTPYPEQEQNAIDCVMQFAIHRLRFDPENILIYGWSIGGYTASWAAMNYPDVKGLVLDATFDDILPIAIPHMPKSWEPLVRRTIRGYINLNVGEQVCQYKGPVMFIRRTRDEIICTVKGDLSTNRGNHLAAKLLKYRYPKIVDYKRQQLLNQWLASDGLQQSILLNRHHIDKDVCNSLLTSYIEDNSLNYPMHIGENFTDEQKNSMMLFLADKYLKSFGEAHCEPLPTSLFRMPWTPNTTDSSFVKI